MNHFKGQISGFQLILWIRINFNSLRMALVLFATVRKFVPDDYFVFKEMLIGKMEFASMHCVCLSV